MKKYLFSAVLWMLPLAPALASEALFTHCVTHWSQQAVGEVACHMALQRGYPVGAPFPQRSCVRAYLLGKQYFSPDLFDVADDGILKVSSCATLTTKGPDLFPEW